jgi:hypothetical protein
MSTRGVQWLRSGADTLLTLGSGGPSSSTAALGAQCYVVRVATGTAPAFVKIGDNNPTADSSGGSLLMPANSTDYLVTTPGQKVAAIAQSAAALVTVTEMS